MYMASERKRTFPACVEGRRPASTLLKRTGSGFYHSARLQRSQVQEVRTLRSEVMLFVVIVCFKYFDVRKILKQYIVEAALNVSAIKFYMYSVCNVHVKLKEMSEIKKCRIKCIYRSSVTCCGGNVCRGIINKWSFKLVNV